MKKVIFTTCLLIMAIFSFGQDNIHLPSFSDNQLLYNPAYTGSTGKLDASILHYRGSNTFNIKDHLSVFSISSPIGKGNWSIGGNMIYEKFYIYDFGSIDGTVAYHKGFKNGGKLSLGALISVERHHSDINSLDIPGFEYAKDIAFVPQFGTGVIYQTQRGYVSISAPNMFYVPYIYTDNFGTEFQNYTKNDIYISGGLNRSVFNGKLQILPALTYHRTSQASLWNSRIHDIDLGASFIFFDKIRFGSTFHTTIESITQGPDLMRFHALDLRLGVNLKNGLRIGTVLESHISRLNNRGFSTLNGGITLGYRVSNSSEIPYLGTRHFF